MNPYHHYATPRFALEQLPNLVVACQEELARELGWSQYYYDIFASSKFFTAQTVSYRFSLRADFEQRQAHTPQAQLDPSAPHQNTEQQNIPQQTAQEPLQATEVIPALLAQELSAYIQQVIDRPLQHYACAASAELQGNQHSQLFTPINVNQLPLQQYLREHDYSWSQVSNYFHTHNPDINLWQALQVRAEHQLDWSALAPALPEWFNNLPAEFKDKLRHSPRLPQLTLRNLLEVYSQLRAHEWLYWSDNLIAPAPDQIERNSFTLPDSHHAAQVDWSRLNRVELLQSNLLAQSLLNPAFEYNLLESNSSMALHADFDYLEQEVHTFAAFKPHLAKGSYKNPRYLQILPRHSELLCDPKFAASLETIIQDWLILELTLERLNLTWDEWCVASHSLEADFHAHNHYLTQWFNHLRDTYNLHPELQSRSGEQRLFVPYCYLCSRADLDAYAHGELEFNAMYFAINNSSEVGVLNVAQGETQLPASHEILRYEALLVLLNQQLRTNCQTQYLLAHRQVQLLSQVQSKHNTTTDLAYHADFVQICDADTIHHDGWVATLGNLTNIIFNHDLGVSHLYYGHLEQPQDFLTPPFHTWSWCIRADYHSKLASQKYFTEVQDQQASLDPQDYLLNYQAIDLEQTQAYLQLDYAQHPFTQHLSQLELQPTDNLGIGLVSYTHNLTYPSTSLGRFQPEHLPQLQHLLTTQAHHTGARTTYVCVYRLTQLEQVREYRNQETPNSEQDSSTLSAAASNLEAATINQAQSNLTSSIASATYWSSINNPIAIAPLWQELSSATEQSHEYSASDSNSSVRSLQGYLFAPSMCSMLRSARADAQFLSYTATKQIDLAASDALTLCGYYQLFDLRATHLAQAHTYTQVNAYTWELRNHQLSNFTQVRVVAPRSYGEFTLEDNSEYIGLHSIYQVDVLTPLAQRSHKAEQVREPYIVQFHNEQSQLQAQANLQTLNQQASELSLNPSNPTHLRNQLNLKLHDLSRTSHAELQAWREQIENLPKPTNRLSNLYQALTHLELKKLFASVLHNQHLQESDWVTVLHDHYEVQDNFLACLQTWQQHTGVGFMVLDTALHSHVMHCYFGRGDNSRHTYLSLNPRNVLFPSNYQRLFTATMPYYNRAPQTYLGQGLGLNLADNWKLGLNFATHVPQLRPDLLTATIAHRAQLVAQQRTMWQGIQLTATTWYLGLLLAQLKVTQGQTLKYPNLNYSQYHLNRGKEILRSELERLQQWTQSFNLEVAQEQQAWLEHLATQLSSSKPVAEQWQTLQEQLTQTLQATNALHAQCAELIQEDVGNLEHLLRCNINQLAEVTPNPASEQLLRCHFQVVDTLTTLEAVTAFQTPLADELADLIHNYLALQTTHLQLSNSNYASVELADYISWLQSYTRTYATTPPVTHNLNLAQLVALCMQYWLHLPTTRCSSNVLHGVALESHIEHQAGILGQQQLCFRWRCLPQEASTLQPAHTLLEITPAPTSAPSSHPSWMQYKPVSATHTADLRELFAARAQEFHSVATVAPQLQTNWSRAYQEVYQHTAVAEHLLGNYLQALTTIHASTHFSYIPPQLQALQVQFSSAPITVRIEKLEPDAQRRELWLTGRNPVYREYKYPLCELFNLSPLSLWRNQLLAGYAPHNENEKLVSAGHTAHAVSPARDATTRAPHGATVAWHEFACLLDYLAFNIYPHAGLGHTGNIMPLQTGQVIDIMSKYRHIDNQIDIDNDYIDLPVQFYAQRLNYPTIANRFTMRGLENFAITKELIRKLQPVWEQPDFRTSDLISGLADLEAQETRHNDEQGITRGNYHILVTRAQLLKSNLPTIGTTDLGIAHHWNNPFATQVTASHQTYLEIRYLNLDVDTLKARTLEEIFVLLRAEFARYGVDARLVRQPAVHGRKLAATEYYERFDEEGFKQKYYRVPAFGEVGCTLSYIEHMHAIAASEHIQAHEYVLMIEDDLSFARSFVERVVTILRQLEQMQADPCQHPPRWVNGFHYLFNSLSPIDPRDFKQFEHTHIHGLHTQYQVAGVNILRLERFTTSGSVCSLIRKDLAQTISRNLREQQLRPYWLADDFIEYPGMSNSDYAFTNPRLTILAEEYHDASNINDERARKRAYATYLGQPLPTY